MNKPVRRAPYPSQKPHSEHREAYAWLLDRLADECDEVHTQIGDYGWRFEVIVRWGEGESSVRIGIAPEREIGCDEEGWSYFSLNGAIARGQITHDAVIGEFLKSRPATWKRAHPRMQ